MPNESWSSKVFQTVYLRYCSGNTSHMQWHCRFVQISNSNLVIGTFSADQIQKEFVKQQKGSGGTCFITVPQIIQKVKRFNQGVFIAAN